MSVYKYTRPVEISLELHDGEVAIRFVDAAVAQWSEPIGPLSEWDDDEQLISEIASEIDRVAEDLAKTIVDDLRNRVLKEVNRGEATEPTP